MKIQWPIPIDEAGRALRKRAESLGYVSVPDGVLVSPEEPGLVLHVICPRGPLDQAGEAVRAVRQMLAVDAVLLAAGEWVEPAEIGTLLAAGADDYIALNCETRELAVRLLALRLRVEGGGRAQTPLEERLRSAQRLETLGSLAGVLAHDYNNLLAAIQGNAQLALMDRSITEAVKYSLAQIDTAAQRAGDMTKQMLAYASNRDAGKTRTLNLNQILREMTELLRVSVPHGCTFKYSLARNAPPVAGRAAELRQLILNLAWNACESQGGMGGEVKIRTGFDESAQPALVTLEVEDDGPGISAEDRLRIFDPQFSTKGGQRGLGLAAARVIAESHGGSLDVVSTPGSGACFRFTMPPIPGWHMQTHSSAGLDAEEQLNATLLLIDDEPAVREVAEKMLRRVGHTVFVTDSYAEGWSLCEQIGAALDVVILDLSLPGLDPKELVRRIRSAFPRMQIVVWSGAEESAVHAKLAGAEPYHLLPKQPRMNDFVASIQDLLRAAKKA
ncbi:hybrid sensor histidine kinase/response regulator [Paludibaculum fermentans]|uniref:histidine kinase n=1 Tax=Paludibaculum fermentans TaxID=1473598 RepID=A0A7S7NKT0_PALFE|nr:ATP-binding protein [Paludibaculum fermentans]QOY85466.1 response regulator [Paludibaculum fermentans]